MYSDVCYKDTALLFTGDLDYSTSSDSSGSTNFTCDIKYKTNKILYYIYL